MIRMTNPTLRAWARIVTSQGWTVEYNGRHWRWTAPDGAFTFTPATPGRARSLKNARSVLNRMLEANGQERLP
jgi:hypothetical protein